jgi:ubiquitin C-terminal hydrolase
MNLLTIYNTYCNILQTQIRLDKEMDQQKQIKLDKALALALALAAELERPSISEHVPIIDSDTPHGIQNEGNTCYFNSLIHFLRSMKKLFLDRNIDLNAKFDNNINNLIKFINCINPNLNNFRESDLTIISTYCDLNSLINFLKLEDIGVPQPSDEAFVNFIEKAYNFLHIDTLELNREIHNYTIIDKVEYRLYTDLQCQMVYNSLISPTIYLNLEITQFSIQELLNEFFNSIQLFNSNNGIDANKQYHTYYYNKDNKVYDIASNVTYIKGEKINVLKYPLYLIFFLGRYNNVYTKNVLEITIDEIININGNQYKFLSKCKHMGTLDGGHYINISLRSNNKYYEYDDSNVRLIQYEPEDTDSTLFLYVKI